ncbi:hypothetical protein SDC9_132638 [bioreactor metagenome]|uniref:Uncharacterized protein n=1 Tax=bioreactor metagenome TaxID=1076179 RepID=A0A645D8M3_9ZZZZ
MSRFHKPGRTARAHPELTVVAGMNHGRDGFAGDTSLIGQLANPDILFDPSQLFQHRCQILKISYFVLFPGKIQSFFGQIDLKFGQG